MGKDFETMLQTIIADYIDGKLSKQEKIVLELIIESDSDFKDYIDDVQKGRAALKKLPVEKYNGPFIYVSQKMIMPNQN